MAGKTPLASTATATGPFGNTVIGTTVPFDDYTGVSVLGTSSIPTITLRSSSTGITGLQVTYSYPANLYGNSTVTHGSTTGTVQTFNSVFGASCISKVTGKYNAATTMVESLTFTTNLGQIFTGGLASPLASAASFDGSPTQAGCLVAINGRKTSTSVTQLSFLWGPYGERVAGCGPGGYSFWQIISGVGGKLGTVHSFSCGALLVRGWLTAAWGLVVPE